MVCRIRLNFEKRLLTLLVLLLTIVISSNCDDAKSYTKEEKALLPNLRKRVYRNLTQDIMHEDKYLVRFLRAQNHDVGRAAAMIHRNLEWRQKNKMDSILKEDWSSWKRRVPFMTHITDHEGRPSLAAGIAYLDARKAVLGGRGAEMGRYIAYAMETGLQRLHLVSNATGKEFIDGWLLFDMAGFNERAHACPPCVPIWLEVLHMYENYYPRLGKGIIVVNLPRLYQRFSHAIKPIMSHHTLQSLRIYDFDKGAWRQELLKIFPENKLTTEFGGTGPSKVHN